MREKEEEEEVIQKYESKEYFNILFAFAYFSA